MRSISSGSLTQRIASTHSASASTPPSKAPADHIEAAVRCGCLDAEPRDTGALRVRTCGLSQVVADDHDLPRRALGRRLRRGRVA